MIGAEKLSLNFDPDRLSQDLATIDQGQWNLHYKNYHYKGDWSALALRSASGRVDDLSQGGGSANYQSTPLLNMTPNLAGVLEVLDVPTRRVRLMRLAAGSEINEHIDSYRPIVSEVRLHIPIQTDPRVEFRVNGKAFTMKRGECWYLDVNSPRAVANHSDIDRIHLVIDCEIVPRLRELIAKPFPFEHPFWRLQFMARSVLYRQRDLAEQSRQQNRFQISIPANQAQKKIHSQWKRKSTSGRGVSQT